MQIHVATQYLVDWQGINCESWVFSKTLEELSQVAEANGLTEVEDLILWEDEDGKAWELSKHVLTEVAKVYPRYKEFCDKLVENSPDYNDFVRVELF
jgi:hypothetical protein